MTWAELREAAAALAVSEALAPTPDPEPAPEPVEPAAVVDVQDVQAPGDVRDPAPVRVCSAPDDGPAVCRGRGAGDGPVNLTRNLARLEATLRAERKALRGRRDAHARVRRPIVDAELRRLARRRATR